MLTKMNNRLFKRNYLFFEEKKIILIFFFTIFFSLNVQVAKSNPILKGGISTVIKKGEELKINFSTPVDYSFSLPGDSVSVYLSEDVDLGNNTFIPKGSKLNGQLTKIVYPKRLGLDGYYEINLNELITPDNKRIPVYANISTNSQKNYEKAAKILTYDSALIAYGTVHGAIAGLQIGGIPLAISSYGISVLSGAGIGTTGGIIGSLIRKGDIQTTSSQEPVRITLNEDLHIFGDLTDFKNSKVVLSGENKEEQFRGFRFYESIKEEDIGIRVDSITKKKDKTYGRLLTLDLYIKNNSDKKLSLSNIVLIDKEIPIYPDLIFSGINVLENIDPMGELSTTLTFLVKDFKANYRLALIDPLDSKKIVSIPIDKK